MDGTAAICDSHHFVTARSQADIDEVRMDVQIAAPLNQPEGITTIGPA